MKFKATISVRGLKVLEKGFLPTLDKFGKQCQLLLSNEAAHFFQDERDSDGMQIMARLANDVLYEPGTLVCQSRYHNLIAFAFEIPLMVKVLKSAVAHRAEFLDVRLALRNIPAAATQAGPTQPQLKRPVLAFSWKGSDVTITQDMPISKPHVESAVDELQRLCNIPSLCPFYVDIVHQVPHVQAVVDKLKNLASEVTLVTTKQGDLHLCIRTGGVQVGEGIQGLDVRPQAASEEASSLTSTSAEGRLREAQAAGDAASACLTLKNMARALHSSLLTAPDLLLCGVAGDGGYVHMVFAYRDPSDDAGYDDDLSLSFKLPVLEDGIM